MLERPRSGERAILLQIGAGRRPGDDERREFEELARSAGAVGLSALTVPLRTPDPRYLIGTGKVEALAALVRAEEAELVLVNRELSPSQERNLERSIECRVLDRAGLILDIFAQRARSFEGKLQVELAQLRHLSTRLVRGWTHLERQKGGIGLRGPGETQLETDRRLIGQRIRQLRRRLDRVATQREQGRATRRKASVPTVSLVGYTNAGKSTLFNRLTGADVYAADKLFATLDPTLRRMNLQAREDVVLADTVGFIRDLPPELVTAFRATLEETCAASLLLHVIDAGDERRRENIEEVDRVLEQIGASAVPQLAVYNKIDRLDVAPHVERDADGRARRVWVSARDGAGLELLDEAIRECLSGELYRGALELAGTDARLRARLHEVGAVRAERPLDTGGWRLEVEISVRTLRQMCAREGFAAPHSACALADGSLQSGAGLTH